MNGLRDSGLVGISADTLTVEGVAEGPNARLIRTSRYSNLFFLDFRVQLTNRMFGGWRVHLVRCHTRYMRLAASRRRQPSTDSSWCPTSSKVKRMTRSSKLKRKFRNSPDSFVEYLLVQAPDLNSPLEAKAVGIPMSQLPRRGSCGVRPIAFLMSFA